MFVFSLYGSEFFIICHIFVACESEKLISLSINLLKFINFYLQEMREGEEYAKIFCKKNNFEFIKCNANFFYVYFNFDSKKIQNYLAINIMTLNSTLLKRTQI